MEKTIRALNGIFCIELEEIAPQRKEILSSKSFGRPVTELEELSQAVTLYMTRTAEKLRNQQSAAGSVQVYIQTSKFKLDQPFYTKSVTIPMPSASDDTRRLVVVAPWALKKIHCTGFNYSKAWLCKVSWFHSGALRHSI